MFDPIEIAKASLKIEVGHAPLAQVVALNLDQASVVGWAQMPEVGALARLRTKRGTEIIARVTESNANHTILQLPSGHVGLGIGDPAWIKSDVAVQPAAHWLGRTVDPRGRPIDGRRLALIPRGTPHPQTPPALARRPMGERLETGFFAFNTFLPIVRGQRLGIFAGSGVGKSTLLGGLARHIPADVVVVALVGERGHEVRAFKQEILGAEGMERAVLVAATSDQPAQERRLCVETATRVAESFRDQGKHVLLLVDSVTRLAEAHREVETERGLASNCRGFPSSTQALVAGLCERAGPGTDTGSITALYTVLVAGSDMDEPIADMLRGILDGHVVLDRRIAERGRFPAVDLLRSVSRSVPFAVSGEEAELLSKARHLLSVYSEAELMITSGLYSAGANVEIDRAIAFVPRLEALLAQENGTPIQICFEKLAALLSN